jgi:urea carboxylase-associated protein 2
MESALYDEVIPGGGMWSMRLARNRLLRLTTQAPGANVSALFFNALNTADRLNVPDTLKALHTAKLHRGHILMSDMGVALVSIVEDTLGWHDPLGGHSTAAHVSRAFGELTYQEARNDFHRNAHDGFLIELLKYGLSSRDLVANVNFFTRVTVATDGSLEFHPQHAPEATILGLRTDTDVIAIFANCPHPLHPPGAYPRVPVRVEILRCAPAGEDDYCRNFRPECHRALTLAERLHL